MLQLIDEVESIASKDPNAHSVAHHIIKRARLAVESRQNSPYSEFIMARSGHLRRLRATFDRAVCVSRSAPNSTKGQSNHDILTVEYWRGVSRILKFLEISGRKHLQKSQTQEFSPGTLPLRANGSEIRTSTHARFMHHGRLDPSLVEIERVSESLSDAARR